MRIVIGGGSEVGRKLASALDAHHEVVVVKSQDVVRTFDDLDAAVVEGSLTSSVVLKEAAAGRADLFIACTENDERNLVACVAAQRLGADRTVCFLFRRDIRSSMNDDVRLARSLGIDEVVRPSLQLAQEIVRIVSVPGALDVEVFADGKVRLLRHEVEEGAPITRGPLMEVGAPKGVVLVMGRRGDDIFVPSGRTKFQAGDKLTAMGTAKPLGRLISRHLRAPGHERETRSATVVGGGMVGLAVTQGLEEAGWDVKLIEANRQRCEEIAPLVKGLVLYGDGADRTLLEQEHVSHASVLVAVTSSDEKNLLVSLMAKDMGVQRLVTRADDSDNERLFDRVGIDVVRSARGTSVNSIVRRLVSGRAELLAELEHGDAQVLDLELPPGITPVTLSKMHQPVFAIVGAILRAGAVIIPTGHDQIQGGDHILVFCTKADEAEVREFFLEKLHEDAE